ncbi:MAG: methionyl-tRNA formyltransferase, partial [Clostridia bacterium]|nr:methionyl-tRNA formyltransferase [Clostridia bacterium]
LYMGTNAFAVEPLRAINTAFGKDNTVEVITQPDKPKGRSYKMAMSEVKEYSLDAGLTVYQPETLKADFFSDSFSRIAPDLIVVASYGKILPEYILNAPKYGCINIHASLLPEYRGAAPINRVIMDGRKTTGITIMHMAKGLDTGDIIISKETAIGENECFGELCDRLSLMGAEMIVSVIPDLVSGKATRTAQDDSLSSYADKITNEDLPVRWSLSAEEIINKIRGLSPAPCARTHVERLNKDLKIYKAKIYSGETAGEPGTVISLDGRIEIACKGGSIIITELQLEGHKRLSFKDFLNGRKLTVGDKLI